MYQSCPLLSTVVTGKIQGTKGERLFFNMDMASRGIFFSLLFFVFVAWLNKVHAQSSVSAQDIIQLSQTQHTILHTTRPTFEM